MNTDVTGRRIVAGLIDALILTGVFVGLAAAMGNLETEDASFSVELENEGFLLFLACFFAYYFLAETLAQTTIGKGLLGLRVVAEDGTRAPGGKIALRTVLRFIDALPFFYIVGLVTIAVTGERKARIGDLAANTRVVARSSAVQ